MEEQQQEMSFLGHLEELRWHLVRSVASIFILAIIFFAFATEVYNHFLLAHIKPDFITYQLFCDFFNLFGMDSHAYLHITRSGTVLFILLEVVSNRYSFRF